MAFQLSNLSSILLEKCIYVFNVFQFIYDSYISSLAFQGNFLYKKENRFYLKTDI